MLVSSKVLGNFCRNILFARTFASSTAGGAVVMGKLTGKVAIVTASTDGIGYAIAKRLAEDGAKVVVSSRKDANVKKTTDDFKALNLDVRGVVCHVGKADDRQKLIQETVNHYGGIDILVSNAAVNPYFGTTLDCPEESWDRIFDINVKCSFLLSKEIVPHMLKKGSGAIVFVSSIGGIQPFSALGPYSISKTALLGMTKVLAQELASSNIRVNCLAPGIIKTKFSSALHESKEMLEEVLKQIPMGRIGLPQEMSGLVSFLCSDDASYITGETFVAAGGMQSRL